MKYYEPQLTVNADNPDEADIKYVEKGRRKDYREEYQ